MRVALIAALVCAACVTGGTSLGGRALYLTDSFDGSGLIPIDPLTLRDLSSKPLLPIGKDSPKNSVAIASEDGSTLAVANYSYAREVPTEPLDVSVFDARTGAMRARFKPEVPVVIDYLSADGSRIHARSWPPRELTRERVVLDAADGRVVLREPAFSLEAEEITFATDREERRLYPLLTAPAPGATGPRAVELAAWDLRSGIELWRLPLPSLLAGEWLTGRTFAGIEIRSRLVPGIALSPDRRTLAIACCSVSGTLWLVDAPSGRLLSQRAFGGAGSILDRLFTPSVALAKSPSDSVILTARFGADGRVLHLYAESSRADEQGGSIDQHLGMVAVSLEDAKSLGTDVKTEAWWYENRIFWSLASPDGKWLYVFLRRGHAGPTGYVLRRLDARTLGVREERRFDSYRQAFLLLTARSDSPRSASWLDQKLSQRGIPGLRRRTHLVPGALRGVLVGSEP